LDFDPRGKVIDLVLDGTWVAGGPLLAQANGINSCKYRLSEKSLTRAAGSGTAQARYELRNDCSEGFRVKVQNAPNGIYDLYVDGELRGSFEVSVTSEGTEGKIEFDTQPDDSGELYLSFDPSNADIELRKGATVYFSGKLTGKPGTPSCDWEETELPLFNTGAAAVGVAKVKFQQDADCDQRLRVEVKDLVAGVYRVRVAGAEQGTVVVDESGEGRVELGLDPRGQLIEIVLADAVYFFRLFP
jgi:hypothetical protein